MNFGELKAAITAQIGRSPSDLAYTLAQADIAKKLKLLEMETTTTLTAGMSIALPSDFNGVIAATLEGTPLSPAALQTQDKQVATNRTTNTYSISGTNMLLTDPGTGDLELTYWARPLLVDDEDTNGVLDTYPDLYVYGVLTHHAGLIRDLQAASGWAQGYTVAITDAQTNDAVVRMSGGQPGVYVRTAP